MCSRPLSPLPGKPDVSRTAEEEKQTLRDKMLSPRSMSWRTRSAGPRSSWTGPRCGQQGGQDPSESGSTLKRSPEAAVSGSPESGPAPGRLGRYPSPHGTSAVEAGPRHQLPLREQIFILLPASTQTGPSNSGEPRWSRCCGVIRGRHRSSHEVDGA